MPPAGNDPHLRVMISAHNQLMWCEQMQDMSGHTTDTTLSHLDELSILNNTITPEYDLIVQNSGHPSPDEYLESDQDKNSSVEEFNMFDNNGNRYQQLDTEIDKWLRLPPTPEIEEVTQNLPLSSEDWVCLPHSGIKLIPDTTTEQSVKKQSGNLTALIDSEEPTIASAYGAACNDVKPFIVKYDMDVAEEVEVTTEEESPSMSMDSHFGYGSEDIIDIKTEDNLSPLGRCSSPPMYMGWAQNETSPPHPRHRRTLSKLDIGAATMTSASSAGPPMLDIASANLVTSQILNGIQPDTPDVLKPLLNPVGFDIVEFLLEQGDDNNNVPVSSPTEEARCLQVRQGKSHLTMTELKSSRETGRSRRREWRKPSFSPTTSALPSRPSRKSAEKSIQMMEEVLHAEEVASEDEEPKKKRRRSDSSSSSRRRLNSDSDLSSVCDDPMKYRERRDRNNLSSKISREKRKRTQQMEQQELKDLEAKNSRLKKELEELEKTLNQTNTAWQKYLERVKRENQRY